MQISWNNGTELDKEATEKAGSLLKRKLTADDAVQIALLNNRDLQAVYSDLGVAQADLVQAGLLSNPIFDAAVMFPVSGGGQPDLELSAAMNFLNIFYIPLRKRVAAARFEEVKTRLAGSVLDFAGRVREQLSIHIRRMSKCSNCARRLFKRSTLRWKLRAGFLKPAISPISTSQGNGHSWRPESWLSEPRKLRFGKAGKN